MHEAVSVAGAGPAISDIKIIRLQRLDLRFAPKPWPFAIERRAEIDAYFKDLQRDKPALYNGRVLVMHQHALAGGVLRGSYLETDYASFIAWRDWGFPDHTMKNCFALGALRGADGGFLLGVMGAHTANAGRIYFPGGTPDPSDVVAGLVDLDSNVRREIEEETGLGPDDFSLGPSWYVALAGPRLGLLKVLQAREPAAVLRERILRHLTSEATPELADIRILRGPSELTPMMPNFVHAFLLHVWKEART